MSFVIRLTEIYGNFRGVSIVHYFFECTPLSASCFTEYRIESTACQSGIPPPVSSMAYPFPLQKVPVCRYQDCRFRGQRGANFSSPSQPGIWCSEYTVFVPVELVQSRVQETGTAVERQSPAHMLLAIMSARVQCKIITELLMA